MTWGEFFTGLGYATGLAVLIWAARERNLFTSGMMRIALVAVFAGAVGAKLTEFLFEGWPLKIGFATILDPDSGGKSLLGGLVIGWVAAVLAKRRMGIRRSTGDLFALALPAGEAVGRIGCYFNGCCYGISTNSSFAIYQHGAWRYPTQIYSSITAAMIFVVLLLLRRHVAKEGDLFKLYLLLFGITRFGIEFMREKPLLVWGLSAMQIFCIELVLFGGITLWISARKKPLLTGAVPG